MDKGRGGLKSQIFSRRHMVRAPLLIPLQFLFSAARSFVNDRRLVRGGLLARTDLPPLHSAFGLANFELEWSSVLVKMTL